LVRTRLPPHADGVDAGIALSRRLPVLEFVDGGSDGVEYRFVVSIDLPAPEAEDGPTSRSKEFVSYLVELTVVLGAVDFDVAL
jgi:hypothetical protein